MLKNAVSTVDRNLNTGTVPFNKFGQVLLNQLKRKGPLQYPADSAKTFFWEDSRIMIAKEYTGRALFAYSL